jgi:hypothetical protein
MEISQEGQFIWMDGKATFYSALDCHGTLFFLAQTKRDNKNTFFKEMKTL